MQQSTPCSSVVEYLTMEADLSNAGRPTFPVPFYMLRLPEPLTH